MLFSYRQSEIILRHFGNFILLLLYLFVSCYMGRGFLAAEGDGFAGQMIFIEENSADLELGTLSILHRIRYLIVKPFLWMDNIWFEPALFFCYIGVAVFFVKHWQMRFIIKLSLIFSLFFSFRTVLCMFSIALLTQCILFGLDNYKNIKELPGSIRLYCCFFYGILFAFLSSGVLVVYLMLFFCYRKLIIRSERDRWVFNVLFVVSAVAVLGAVVHKVFFFSDTVSFGSANAISMQSFFMLDVSSLSSVFSNLIERGILAEALRKSSLRIYVVTCISLLGVILLCVRRDRLAVLLVVLLVFGLFMEGLIVYSLLMSILLLIAQWVDKRVIF